MITLCTSFRVSPSFDISISHLTADHEATPRHLWILSLSGAFYCWRLSTLSRKCSVAWMCGWRIVLKQDCIARFWISIRWVRLIAHACDGYLTSYTDRRYRLANCWLSARNRGTLAQRARLSALSLVRLCRMNGISTEHTERISDLGSWCWLVYPWYIPARAVLKCHKAVLGGMWSQKVVHQRPTRPVQFIASYPTRQSDARLRSCDFASVWVDRLTHSILFS